MANLEEKAGSAGGRSLLVGAIAFGLIAALLGYFYLKSREAALVESLKGKDEKMVAVVVAKQDLNRGAMITKQGFSQRNVPSRFVHDDAVLPGDFANFEGQALTAKLGRGKTLLRSFVDREFPVDFSDTIEIGRRAMTVKVDEVNSIAGFLRPGNHVDIFVNIPFKATGFDATVITAGLVNELPSSISSILPPVLVDALESGGGVDQDTIDQLMSSSAPTDIIMPVLQNVKVLATGRDPYRENLDRLRYPQSRSERNFSTVTIDVDPRQAALLSAAEDKGDLLAYLRNRDDTSLADFSGISADDLFANASRMATAAEEQNSRLSVPGGTDSAGNLVDADGNTILSARQLA
ncbi:MAG: Flp pilus assembly protein CpaB, partial [Pseudomonadota bacterium]